MAGVKIYGSMRSRARRSIWCAKECGVPFEIVEVDRAAQKEPAYLAINPNGKVPAMVDGDVKLFESLVINLYLAKKYGAAKGMWPSTTKAEAETYQWTVWSQTELEPAMGPALAAAFGGPNNPEAITAGNAKVKDALMILDHALKGRQWLVEDHFTVADLNMAGVVTATIPAKIDISYAHNVQAWMGRCASRPAAQG